MRGARWAPLLALVVLGLCVSVGCDKSQQVWRDTWEPVDAQGAGGLPRVVVVALQVGPADLDALAQAGGHVIGYHRTTKGYALRAGSTGGTHFVPVAETRPKVSTRCYSSPRIGLTSCATSSDAKWTRVAVVRVEPDSWRRLPPALVPLEDEYSVRQPDAVVRVGCKVHRGWGHTKCSNDWAIVSTHDLRGR